MNRNGRQTLILPQIMDYGTLKTSSAPRLPKTTGVPLKAIRTDQ
jgi:hypothetical protein